MSNQSLRIEISTIKKTAVPEYTIEAEVVGLAGCSQYFYGHSKTEVLAKILAKMLEQKP